MERSSQHCLKFEVRLYQAYDITAQNGNKTRKRVFVMVHNVFRKQSATGRLARNLFY